MEKETAIRTCAIAEAKERLGYLTRKAHNRHRVRKIKTPPRMLDVLECVILEGLLMGSGRMPTYQEIRKRAFKKLKNGQADLLTVASHLSSPNLGQ